MCSCRRTNQGGYEMKLITLILWFLTMLIAFHSAIVTKDYARASFELLVSYGLYYITFKNSTQ